MDRNELSQHAKLPIEEDGRYEIRCDDCQRVMGRTDSMARSAMGGRCVSCTSDIVRSILGRTR